MKRSPKQYSVKLIYKGHEVNVQRELSLSGESLLFYSIFRISDGLECSSGFSYDNSTPRKFSKYLIQQIDSELKSQSPWS